MLIPVRFLAIFIMLVSVVADINDFEWITRADMQLIIGIIVVSTIVFIDAVTGLAIGLAVLIMYMRVHADKLGVDLGAWSQMRSKPKNYITPEHLKDAQDNVFDADNYGKEMIGIRDPYDKGVWGAQGMDSKFPGALPVEYENNWETM